MLRSMSLLAPGVTLIYEMADPDVSDTYRFVICDADAGLTFTSALHNQDFEDEGFAEDDLVSDEAVQVAPAALAEGRHIAALSQGSWLAADLGSPPRDADDVIELTDLPPFLLSRAVLRELRFGATRLRPEWSRAGLVELTLRERATAEIERDGETLEVEVLVARGDGIELTVLDDDEHPLVLERVEGDKFWRLQAIGHEPDEFDDDDDDDLPPEPAGPLAPTGRLDLESFVALTRSLGVVGMEMDREGTRFMLLDDRRRIVLSADYKLLLVALPGGVLRRAHALPRYGAEQVLAPLAVDDPVDQPGGVAEGLAIAADLAERGGADVLYPGPLGPLFIALYNVRALSS